mgnify:CR=1 FL=1
MKKIKVKKVKLTVSEVHRMINLVHIRIDFCEEGSPDHRAEYAPERRKLKKILTKLAAKEFI